MNIRLLIEIIKFHNEHLMKMHDFLQIVTTKKNVIQRCSASVLQHGKISYKRQKAYLVSSTVSTV